MFAFLCPEIFYHSEKNKNKKYDLVWTGKIAQV